MVIGGNDRAGRPTTFVSVKKNFEATAKNVLTQFQDGNRQTDRQIDKYFIHALLGKFRKNIVLL